MPSERERLILERAVRKGWLTSQEVSDKQAEIEEAETLKTGVVRWGALLDSFVKDGLLTNEAIERLEAETSERLGAHASLSTNPTFITEPDTPFSYSSSGNNSGRRYQAAFPVQDWPRYQFISLLGEGGWGRVYKARDHRLNRYVALKFIRYETPEVVQRFFQEARLQAKIEHDHVCKVYEVGEVEGQPYIAMQFINGQPLKELKEQLTLEQRVKVMKEVAEAIQSAHRLGLIHRDIKPANIMLERSEEAGWRPYVMDFGLARDIDAQSNTVSGTIMGTPAYMSPEQAMGNIQELDRRADVYSLGATLYDLLTGSPPFSGGMEVVAKVVMEEPPPPRRINSRIPVDLETIVLKCLEKDPTRRYDSAKALAEDLQRFLDGEPISARQATLLYRIRKKARKHRTLVAVLAVALIVVTALAGMGVQARRNARAQAEEAQRLGQQFGRRVNEIESLMRYAALAPLHDTQRERDTVRALINEMEAKVAALGGVSAGAGHYAIGSGYLALQEYELARERLDKAWALGYREPAAAYALGQVYGELYKQGLEAAQALDAELRDARIRELEKSLRDPALDYLKASNAGETVSPAYVEGLIAFYEKSYDAALEKARAAMEKAPWLYEARRLAGDIYVKKGFDKHNRGDYAGALSDYERAGAIYREAMAIGESEASVYEAECERCLSVMDLDIARGKNLQATAAQALQACDRALAVHSRGTSAYVKKMRIYLNRAYDEQLRLDNNLPTLAAAIELGERAISLNPRFMQAYHYLGDAYYYKGEQERWRGQNPQAALAKAIEYYQEVLRVNPNHVPVLNALGNTYETKGEDEHGRGLDPRAAYNSAIASFERALQIKPDYYTAYSNMGVVYKQRALYEVEQGSDPTATLTQAVECYNRVLSRDDKNIYAYNNLGVAYESIASYQMLVGADAREALERAIATLRRLTEINPNLPPAYGNLAISYVSKAKFELSRDIDPDESLQAARAAIARTIALAPNFHNILVQASEVELILARRAMRAGAPARHFSAALAAIREALRQQPDNTEFLLTKAGILRWQAEWLWDKKKDASAALREGLEDMAKVRAITPRDGAALALTGALLAQQARLERSPATARQAVELLTEALKINPLLRQEYEPIRQRATALITETQRIVK